MKLEDYYHKYAFTTSQRHQLKLAKDDNLDLELIANPEFSWQQMEILRLALKQGIDISVAAYPGLSVEEMKKLLDQEANKTNLYLKAKHDLRKKQIMTFCLCAGMITIFIIILLNHDTLFRMINQPQLTLKEETTDYYLSSGDFPYTSYIEYDPMFQLSYNTLDTQTTGTQQINYQVSNGFRTTEKQLTVNVIDDINPTLILSETKITLGENDSFDANAYVETASDNIDGNLLEQVTSTTYDPSLEEQDITYSVADHSGNIAEAKLHVSLEKQAPVIINQIVENPSNGNNSSGSSSNQSSHQTTTPATTQDFLFSDGYTFSSATNACMGLYNSSSATTKSCTPIKDADGKDIGMRFSAR